MPASRYYRYAGSRFSGERFAQAGSVYLEPAHDDRYVALRFIKEFDEQMLPPDFIMSAIDAAPTARSNVLTQSGSKLFREGCGCL